MPEEIIKKYKERNQVWAVHWELTYGCNLKCVHCYTNIGKNGKGLSLSQIQEILHQLCTICIIYIVLSGGEPFYRDDIMEIIGMMRKDFFVIILSNASLIDAEQAKRLKELKVSQVEISLYAMDEGIHDSVTGIRGSHAKTIQGIYSLRDAGVRIKIKCPIMKQNFSEYTKVADFAKKLGLRLSASPVIIPRLDGTQDPYEYSIQDKELEIYYLQWLENNKAFIGDPGEPFVGSARDFKCNAGHSSCSITPEGDLKPCAALPVKLGNLLDKNFKELWLDRPDKFLKNLRETALKTSAKCNTCTSVAFCTPCPGANFLEGDDAFVGADAYCGTVKGAFDAIKRHEKQKVSYLCR